MTLPLRKVALFTLGLCSLVGCGLTDDWKDHFRKYDYYTQRKDSLSVRELKKIRTDYEGPIVGHSGKDICVSYIDNGLDEKLDYVIVDHTPLLRMQDNIAIVDEIPPNQEFEGPMFGLLTRSSYTSELSDGTKINGVINYYMVTRSSPEGLKLQQDFDQARTDYDAWKESDTSEDWWFNRDVLKRDKVPENVYEAALLRSGK
ncbi:MAG: hypothetical protein WCV90_03790 [Candidatus Woesearchaeota archaeon]